MLMFNFIETTKSSKSKPMK